MSAERRVLADRVRSALPKGSVVREVVMFGAIAIMLDAEMLVAAGSDGGLLVRIDPSRHDALVTEVGAEPAVMGNGRPMGPRWIRVAPGALESDEELSRWVGIALARRGDSAS